MIHSAPAATRHSDESALAPMRMTESLLCQLLGALGSVEPEFGLPLGGYLSDEVARVCHFDRAARCSAVTYTPDHESIGELLRRAWNPANIRLLGFAHTHPDGLTEPSAGDLRYAARILDANGHLPRLLLPIAVVRPRFELHPYVIVRDGAGVRAVRVELELMHETLTSLTLAPPVVTLPAVQVPRRPWWRPRPWWERASFARVQGAYDLPRLARCRVVVVGTGGAMAWAEEMARCGLGEFTLLDPDEISWPNIGTQQAYRDEIGLPKVDALAARIRRINPHAKVWTHRRALEDLSDEQFAKLCGLQQKQLPLVTLLAAMTDSFQAQARMNRLALHLGLPLLAGQMYAEGRGIEAVWSYPGVSKACHRCSLRPRYRAFMEEGYVNEVDSAGTPIFSTTRLTALKGFLALAMLHHGTAHSRWGGMLERIGQRTLVQARLHPDLELPAFANAFGAGERIFSDETLWIAPPPYPQCPDCDGRGADPSLVGRDGDTRLLRRERSG